MLAVGLVIIGVLSRFVFHFENFTPVLAITLFAGAYLPKRQAIIVPLALFIIADALIGFHALIVFTWGSVVLIALIGMNLENKKSWKTTAVASLLSALLFFVITNFGVWLFYDTYAKSFAGLMECYVMAIPYFRNTLVSTFLYSFVLFGSYEFLSVRLKSTRFASIV